ncbi:sugar phosphate isomerase/epimerase family protein [Amycolatopsis acidicola]|uniref:sugar phosphate isomerase/epimerase family protein n=1 Tax=Amycolatopsis acidicola TaxID=2596893 RepID=UPI001408C652|nr:sugar phosphate isomerase/epimerase [Amycolatopsis acidicola]
MVQERKIKYGIDLITLYDTELWGISDFNQFYDNTVIKPEAFWDKALDILGASGIDGIEITFGPGHWQNALTRYGSAEKFKDAVAERGLEVCSGFFTGLVLDGDWRDEAQQKKLYADVADYADFLRAAGCSIMIAGLPIRTTWNADPPTFIDHDYVRRLSDVLNRMGYIAAQRGVNLSIHPETHAVLWLRRDIDLFLACTDPIYVNFCPDTAHITTGGSNPSEIFKDHHTRIEITHWKDAKSGVPRRQVLDDGVFKSHHRFFARVGLGEVDWPQWVRTLRDHNFEGWAIVELDAASNPPATIAGAKEFIETSLTPIYS